MQHDLFQLLFGRERGIVGYSFLGQKRGGHRGSPLQHGRSNGRVVVRFGGFARGVAFEGEFGFDKFRFGVGHHYAQLGQRFEGIGVARILPHHVFQRRRITALNAAKSGNTRHHNGNSPYRAARVGGGVQTIQEKLGKIRAFPPVQRAGVEVGIEVRKRARIAKNRVVGSGGERRIFGGIG